MRRPGDVIASIYEVCDQWLNAAQGDQAIFTLIDGKQVVYVTYAVRGNVQVDMEDWMRDRVFRPLLERAKGGQLRWRMPARFEVSQSDDGRWLLRTRVAVVDATGEPVIIDDAVKDEGGPAAHVA